MGDKTRETKAMQKQLGGCYSAGAYVHCNNHRHGPLGYDLFGAINMAIVRTETKEIQLTPEEVASEFWGMDEVDQIRFFNALTRRAPAWNWVMQMRAIVEMHNASTGGGNRLTARAKTLIQEMADHFKELE